MFSKECNEYLKTRAGLKSLLANYDLPGITIETAVGAAHLEWCYPVDPNEMYLEAWDNFCEGKTKAFTDKEWEVTKGQSDRLIPSDTYPPEFIDATDGFLTW